MALTRLDLRGRRPPYDDLLPRPSDPGSDVRAAVAAILERVRTGGDGALAALSEEFDHVVPEHLAVDSSELVAALERVSPALRDALQVAYRRIVEYHAHEGKP